MVISTSRRGFLALGAGSTVACLSGCHAGQATSPQGGSEPSSLEYQGPSLTLNYWNGFTGSDGAIMAALVKEFNDSQANIIVDSRTYPWSAFYPNLRQLTDLRLGPDIGVMQADHIATEAVARHIAPIDEIADAVRVARPDFLDEAWDLGSYEGRRYGLPLDVHCLAMFYNKDHFARAEMAVPTDAESFDEACGALRHTAHTQPFWMPNAFPALQIFLGLLWQNGGEPYGRHPTTASFHSDEGVAALAWMVDQVKKGYGRPRVTSEFHWQEFKDRRSSIDFNGIWQIQDASAAGFDYGVAPIPTVGQHSALWANSHQMFVSRRTVEDEHRRLASMVFLDFLTRQSSGWAAAGMIPARNTERQVGMYTQSKQFAFDGVVGDMRFMPGVPGLPAINSETLGTAVRTAIAEPRSSVDSRALLRAAADRANTLLKQDT